VIDVTEELRRKFPVTPVMIKKGIERMIDKEYLERSHEDNSVYSFLA
jgi:cullin 3